MSTSTYNPSDLTFREFDQGSLDFVRELFEPGEYAPIVVIDNGSELTILDGHNRSVVAAERGDEIEAAVITAEQYEMLQAAGFDDMEIAWAALTEAGEHDQAGCLDAQFGGIVAERGCEAWELM